MPAFVPAAFQGTTSPLVAYAAKNRVTADIAPVNEENVRPRQFTTTSLAYMRIAGITEGMSDATTSQGIPTVDSVAPVPSCTFDTNTFSRTALTTEAAAVDSAATVTKSYRYPARDPASNTKLGTLTPITFLASAWRRATSAAMSRSMD